jgi:hypothetical protein
MRSAPRRAATGAALAVLLATLPGAFAQSPSPGAAFEQGKALGRSGNAGARRGIDSGTVQSILPGYTASPSEARFFGSPGLGSAASARLSTCAQAAGAMDPSCMAVDFSQTNPGRRPDFRIAPNDPLLTHGHAIRADPQAIAGNLAGTYSACTVRTVTQPAIVERALCHEARATETLTCDRSLLVQVSERHTCVPGTWYGNFWVNTWGNGEVGRRYAGIVVNAYCEPGGQQRLGFHAICTEAPCAGSAEISVDAASGAVAPQTFANFIGRSWYQTDLFNRVDYRGGGCTDDYCRFEFCTRYEAEESSCWETACTTTKVNESRACGVFAFERPRSIVTVTDAWNDQCAALEVRTR